MGKNLIQQRRGKGSANFRAPSFRYAGRAKYPILPLDKLVRGRIIDLVDSPGHNAPLMEIEFDNRQRALLIAPEGVKVGDYIEIGAEAEVKPGNILPLGRVPEGTTVFNLEKIYGDGGKFVRSSGTSARVVAQMGDYVVVQLPSKKEIKLKPNCRATVGLVAGGGRVEKPFLKAGNKYHAKKARNKRYPKVRGLAMNAVDHPFGGASSHNKGRPTVAPKNAPPGRKVGKIRPRRTGHRR